MIARLKYGISLILGLVLISSCHVKQNTSKPYQFFVAGHVYGAPNFDAKGIYPPFLSVIKEEIIADSLKFGVFTGDIVEKSTPAKWKLVQEDLKELNCPIHFAPGNHDMGNRPLYKDLFGNADTAFSIHQDWFIVMDNTKFGWNPDSSQTALIEGVLNQLKENSRLFIFCHNVVWQDKITCAKSNSMAGKGPENHFWDKVIPMIEEKSSETYWFAGDVGATADSKNVTYNTYQKQHLITSGMGNNILDGYLKVRVNQDSISINFVELQTGAVSSIEKFRCH